MRKLSFVLWVVALSLVVVAAPAFATGDGAPHPSIYQDVLPTEEVPALEVTEQAPVDEVPVEPVPVQEPVFSIPVWAIVGLVSAIVSGLITAWNKERDFKRRIEAIDKQTKDNAEKLFEGLSPTWRSTIDKVLDFGEKRAAELTAALKLAREVTDGQPNTEPVTTPDGGGA